MKLFRYRKPSLNRVLGVTKVKSAIRKASGISTVERYTKPSRIKQSIKQKVGIYSPTMTTIRQTAKGKIPMPLGIPSINKTQVPQQPQKQERKMSLPVILLIIGLLTLPWGIGLILIIISIYLFVKKK